MLVDSLESLASVRTRLRRAVRLGERVGFDTEWDAPEIVFRGKRRPDPLRARLVGFSLAFRGERRGYYIPMTEVLEASARKLLGFLDVPALEVWAHNWKSELHVLHNEGLPVRCRMMDSQICAWLCGWKLPGKGGLKLKALAKEYLGYDGPTFEDIARGRRASEVPAAEMAPYAARDAVLTMALGELAWWGRISEWDLVKQYDLDRRLIPVVADMERTGVPLDRRYLLEAADRCEAEMAEIQTRFHNRTLTTVALPTKVREQAPCPDCEAGPVVAGVCVHPGCVGGKLFHKKGTPKMRTVLRVVPATVGADVGNDRQVARWMFDELRWWPTEGHPRNQVSWSVAEEDIRRFTELEGLPGEMARLRLRFQALRKYASTYTRGLVSLAEQSGDGRLHSSVRQDGTVTGRFATSGPNQQNLPSSERQDLPWLRDLPDIRSAFRCEPGWRVVIRDLSQIELRLLAHFSEAPGLLEVYRTGGDIHARTMERLGCNRRNAKIGNFSVSYKISAPALATKIRMATNDWTFPVRDAEAFIEGWYGEYAGVREWQDEVIEAAESNGYATTITGFKEPITAWGRFSRWGSERKAVNTPIQGSAAGLLKTVLVALHERWRASGDLGVRVRFVMQVHDEIILEAREDFATEALETLGRAMTWVGRKYGLWVPLESSGGIGESWAAAK